MLSKAITGFVSAGLLLAGQAAFADGYRVHGNRNDPPDAAEDDTARVVSVDAESRPYEAQRCEVHQEDSYEDRVERYRVTYVYAGRRQTTQLPYDPGERIRVRVDVQPEEG